MDFCAWLEIARHREVPKDITEEIGLGPTDASQPRRSRTTPVAAVAAPDTVVPEVAQTFGEPANPRFTHGQEDFNLHV
jgi:hypothetical protein